MLKHKYLHPGGGGYITYPRSGAGGTRHTITEGLSKRIGLI